MGGRGSRAFLAAGPAMPDQFNLFGADNAPDDDQPEGFRYMPDLISGADERVLIEQIAALPLAEFQFGEFTGKRRVISFGWRYDFGRRVLDKVDDIPAFLLPLRAKAAAFAELAPEALQHVLVTEYAAGVSIGWHRDRAEFGQVVGVSLLSPCTFRLRRKQGDTWRRYSLAAAPRSVYLLDGEARTVWEHSIPAVDALRYSVTFRNLRTT
jgi:alkylated DNA repair dioxygenase AlkB